MTGQRGGCPRQRPAFDALARRVFLLVDALGDDAPALEEALTDEIERTLGGRLDAEGVRALTDDLLTIAWG